MERGVTNPPPIKRFRLTNVSLAQTQYGPCETMEIAQVDTPNLACADGFPGIWGVAIARWLHGEYGYFVKDWAQEEIALNPDQDPPPSRCHGCWGYGVLNPGQTCTRCGGAGTLPWDFKENA